MADRIVLTIGTKKGVFVAEAKKPIAAVCHGAQLLAAAGVIEGRRISAYPACAPEVKLAGGQYVALDWPDAITDENFVTAPAWTSHVNWLSQFLALLGVGLAVLVGLWFYRVSQAAKHTLVRGGAELDDLIGQFDLARSGFALRADSDWNRLENWDHQH